jgi:uncharacterized protein (DUF1778 family)
VSRAHAIGRLAAALRRVSVSAFVLEAAGREADRVLGQADQTIMPAAEFDALVASLDVADPAPRLRKAAQQDRAFRRR